MSWAVGFAAQRWWCPHLHHPLLSPALARASLWQACVAGMRQRHLPGPEVGIYQFKDLNLLKLMASMSLCS